MVNCKWCGYLEGETSFEGVLLCEQCLQKAKWAAQHPQLCTRCLSLFTDESVLARMLSGEGYSHGLWEELAERGCPLCRIFLLQDPNTDMNRHFNPMLLRAETKRDREIQDADITSLFFQSESEQFKLTLSVSASAGKFFSLLTTCSVCD